MTSADVPESPSTPPTRTTLNRFWAAAVGYEVEDHHDQITELIAAGVASPDDAVEIDGRKAWKIAAASRRPAGHRPAPAVPAGPGGRRR